MRNGQPDLLVRAREPTSGSGSGSGSPDMRSQIRHGDMHIGPKLAQWIFTNCFYPDQERRLKTGRITVLRHVANLRRGRWLTGSQITFCRLPHGHLVLVNGYHRISAIIEFGDAAKFNVQIVDAADEAELRSIFSLFDRRKDSRARSSEQSSNALNFDERLGISKTMSKALGPAIILIQNEYSPVKPTDREKLVEYDALEDLLELALTWKEEAQILDAIVKSSRGILRRKLLLGRVLAVALTTVRFQSERARVFWSNVARNDGLRKNTPEHTLVEWLTTYRLEANGIEGFLGASLAWNAFFTHRPLGVLKVGATSGINIAGTPIDHRV